MQVSVEHCLPGYGTTIPTQIVSLWTVFSINQRFDLGKEGKCGGELFGGEIERRLAMGAWYDYP